MHGVAMCTSVTSVVDSHSTSFDPDMAISRMRRGKNWPREQYLATRMDPAIQFLGEQRDAKCAELLDLVTSLDKSRKHMRDTNGPREGEEALCRQKESAVVDICKEVAHLHPSLKVLLSMTDDEIKGEWERNKVEQGNRGTGEQRNRGKTAQKCCVDWDRFLLGPWRVQPIPKSFA